MVDVCAVLQVARKALRGHLKKIMTFFKDHNLPKENFIQRQMWKNMKRKEKKITLIPPPPLLYYYYFVSYYFRLFKRTFPIYNL